MSDAIVSAPVCHIDFYSDATIADTESAYSAMLKLGPVVWLRKNKLHAICGHSAVVEVLRNHEHFISGKGVSVNEDINSMLVGSTLNSDPPQHDATRKITFEPLSPKNVKHVRERIELEVRYIVDKMLAKGRFDAASELAPHVPLSIVRDLVGLGDYGKDHMLDWGAATFELMGDPKERRVDAIARLKRLRSFLEDSTTLDNLSANGWARRATKLGIESGMTPEKLFAENPDQWQKLRSNRKLMRGAIEEVVRLNTPIRAFTRYVSKDTVVSGTRLKENTRVLVVFGAANRDPQRFDNPNRFDIERKTAGHVGFGQGVHACLGMNLARLEMACLFDALAEKVERFTLSGPVVQGVNSTINSLAHVPVNVELST